MSLVEPSSDPNYPAGIGDVTSDAKGSGARFNGGKPPLEMIPVWILAEGLGVKPVDNAMLEALTALGRWQRGEYLMADVLRCFVPGFRRHAAQVFKHVTERPVKPYPLWNWMKGMPWSVPTACAMRHATARLAKGEINDPETGLPHRGHFMCNLVMLAQFESTYREGDDRPLKWLAQQAA